jgi:hypothetical protein
MQLIVIILYSPVSVQYFTSLQWPAWWLYSNWSVCVLHVGYSKCAKNIFITEQPTTLPNSINTSASVTALPEFLECYLLLYEVYSG